MRRQSESLDKVQQKLEYMKPSSASLQHPNMGAGGLSTEKDDDGIRVAHRRDRSWTQEPSVPGV